MKSRIFGVALLFSALVSLSPTSSTASGSTASGQLRIPDVTVQAVADAKSATYIVFMRAQPAVGYNGGVSGLAPTAPGEGQKIDRRDRNVQRYVRRLQSDQDQALRNVGAAKSAKLISYSYVANGFAANLTAAQARALRTQAGVLFVVRDHIRTIQTDSSGGFLGLTGRKAAYATGITGEDVVVGVIDTGIWPEHPSFADDGTYPSLSPEEFRGTGCDLGNIAFNPADAPFTCNNKLLAAKSYGTVFHGGTGEGLSPNAFLSARDEDGHGTHTASTAAGNANVAATLLGIDRGTVSGIAPRARISVYKACWSGLDGDGCSNGDLVAAIDAAVADGVDVINYSIGSDTAELGPDSISFLLANDAGVFVAASAGNAGPDAGTVGSPAAAPWVTAVGASTQTRDFRTTLTLGDGQTFVGTTVTAGLGSSALVDATALGNPRCLADPGFVAGSVEGKIVLCERGENARVAKSQVLATAGAAGMVLYNANPNEELDTDNHSVPSMHVPLAAGTAIRAYIDLSGIGAKGAFAAGSKVNVQGNVMAAFSSRGPNSLTPDIISPDVTAPGVNILAGNTPAALLGSPNQLFQVISGTSMSSPHVAGIYALLKQAHPDWSPAAAKSALMTTARQNVTKEDGVTLADPFDFGAGHVQPGGDVRRKGSLFNPGLVYDAGADNYLGYLCEADPTAIQAETCADLQASGILTTAENLNLASIGVADIAGATTIGRTITNVTDKYITGSARAKAPNGFKIRVEPSRLQLAPGQSGTFAITFTRTTAEFGTWSFGSLTWEGSNYKVRSPIAVKAQKIAAPTSVHGEGTAGSVDLPVAFGYTGAYVADAHGLIAATRTASTVVDDPTNDIVTAIGTGVGVTMHEIVVPDGTALARFSLSDFDVDGPHDLDLYVFNEAGDLVGFSGSGTSQEEVDVELPPAGTYTVVVHAFDAINGVANYTLSQWLIPIDDGVGSLTITNSPASAVSGTAGTVTAAWTGLSVGTRYLGAISHSDDVGLLGLTIIAVNP